MKDSPRSQAADALRTARESSSNETARKVKAGVKIINLQFEVDPDTKRDIEEESSKIRDKLGFSK